MTQRAIPRTEYTTEIGPIVKLNEMFGKTKASMLLGLTDITHLIRAGKARPAYVIAAQALLDKEAALVPKQEEPKPQSYIVKMSAEEQKLLIPIFEKFGIIYMTLDF